MLPGLIDVDALRKHSYDGKKSGLESELSASSRGQVGGVSGPLKSVSPPISMRVLDDPDFEIEENTYRGAQPNVHYVLSMAGSGSPRTGLRPWGEGEVK